MESGEQGLDLVDGRQGGGFHELVVGVRAGGLGVDAPGLPSLKRMAYFIGSNAGRELPVLECARGWSFCPNFALSLCGF